MTSNGDYWTKNPEYIKLFNFLVEKSKNVESPYSIFMLAKQFKQEIDDRLSVGGLYNRIQNLLLHINGMEHIDTDTKVKLMFALGAPVNQDFLDLLRTEAEVNVDDQQRIINYTKNGERLGRIASPVPWIGSSQRDERLMNFLAQKSRQVDFPIYQTTFLREFKEATGAPFHIDYLARRLRHLKKTIHESDFDEKTKIRMMFVSGVSVPDYYLKVLRKEAYVEVDEYQRIIKYIANDDSLELAGEHSKWAKAHSVSDVETKGNLSQSFFDSDDNELDVSMDSSFRRQSPPEFVTPKSDVVITRSGRVSKKKINLYDDEIDDYNGSSSRKKRASTSSKCTSSLDPVDQDPPRIELKPFRGSILDDEDLLNPMDEDIQVMRRPPMKMEYPMEVEYGIKPKFTSKLKFLEAIESLVVSLDTPTLSRIQAKIQQKIWKIGISDIGISNDEMIPAMDLLVARIANHSVFDLPEYVESVSFKEFLCYLKAVILSLKLEGLEGLLEKIKERNKEVAMMDKKIPVEKVVSVLHHTLDVI